MVLDDFNLVSIDFIFHDSCTLHVFKSMRGSKKNSQSSKLPKPKNHPCLLVLSSENFVAWCAADGIYEQVMLGGFLVEQGLQEHKLLRY